MLMTIIWGALVGGAIAWVWGAISWMALPWHHATFRAFSNEDELERVVRTSCPESGVYGLPAPPKSSPGMDKAARATADRAAQARMMSGPIVTAIVQRGGFGSVPLAMLRAFAIYAVAGSVMTWVAIKTDGQYWDSVGVVTAMGLAAGLICRVTDWNWHGYSSAYTAVNVMDHTVGALLMGLGLAAIV